MLLSEKLIQNTAEQYILRLSGFNLARLSEFDAEYQEMLKSVFIHLCTLGEIKDHSDESFLQSIITEEKLQLLREKIDSTYIDMDQEARSTFWSILSIMLWRDSHRYSSAIRYENRFKDPKLGEFFKALEKSKKQGLFGSIPPHQ
jgi:hypothetical protein